VKLLLEGGANVHALNKWRETPLLTAANHGQAGAVEALLATGADPCKCTDTGWSPLSIAAYKGHDDVVRILLEEGAPTEEDDPTLSALLQAATKGLPDTVELLLRHGADHTVTTKKGDTALSILVEQNLIDAAVEMVTEYNASIPRCSRDRKKVQRARLLINLRMKQLEKEGKENPDSSEGEETDDDYIGDRLAQHVDDDDENDSFNSSIGSKDGKKKKKGGGKVSAEEKARAAEEALLLELAQEDAHAKKAEAEASTKRAKKKKKREREKELKMKEERERQQQKEQEEREREERERIRKEREEKERKERELKLQQEKEREVRELLEREKILVTKRKEREEREKREKEPRQFTRNRKTTERGSISPVATRTNSDEKRTTRVPKGRKVVTDPTPNKKIVSPKSRNVKPVAPLASNRRWETAATKPNKPLSPRRIPSSDNSLTASLDLAPSIPDSLSPPNSLLKPSLSSQDDVMAPSLAISPDSTSNISATQQINGSLPNEELNPTQDMGFDQKELNGNLEHIAQPPIRSKQVEVEHPAVSLFRREKVSELLHRCITALTGLIDEPSLRRVVYRWIIRSAHSGQPCIDPLIPSWMNTDELVAFFQRQFIGESRRHYSSVGMSMSQTPSMESLKEAGASVAVFCHNMAKQVFEYSKRIESQIPTDWTDLSLGMSVTEVPSNGRGATLSVAWGNRANVLFPSITFATLRDRHIDGTESNRFLTCAFVSRIWYDTTRLITKDTSMEFRLPPTTQSCLSAEAAVTAELFADPFTTFGSNVFWGRCGVVDTLFGGQKPFGKEDDGSEKVIARLGGSISVLLPLDNVVAAQYMQRIIAILDEATMINVPVSFTVFAHAECFYEISSNGLSVNDLQFLDPRLGDMQSKRSYLRRVEQLAGGRHIYFDGDVVGSSKLSSLPSLIVLLQNDAGYMRFNVTDSSMARIIASMSVPMRDVTFQPHGMTLQPDYPVTTKASQSGMYYSEPQTPMSPQQQRFVRPDHNSSVPSFSPKTNGIDAISRGRRGRLFALEDDGDEEQLGDVDLLMSGMLNNLDVAGLFKNTTVGSDNIDIEAISLMGIGPPSHSLNPRNTGRFG
jgi:ankyrin repeat protein